MSILIFFTFSSLHYLQFTKVVSHPVAQRSWVVQSHHPIATAVGFAARSHSARSNILAMPLSQQFTKLELSSPPNKHPRGQLHTVKATIADNGNNYGSGDPFHGENRDNNEEKNYNFTEFLVVQALTKAFAARYKDSEGKPMEPTASDRQNIHQVANHLLALMAKGVNGDEGSLVLDWTKQLVFILHEEEALAQHETFLCLVETMLLRQASVRQIDGVGPTIEYMPELLQKYFLFKTIEENILRMLINDELTHDIVRFHPVQNMYKADTFFQLLQHITGNHAKELEQRISHAKKLIVRAREVKRICNNFVGWNWKSIQNYHEHVLENLPVEVLEKCEKKKNGISISGNDN